jgi:hypothetical protein
MSSARALIAVVIASLTCGVVSARADDHVAFVDALTPIAAGGGQVAYSARGADGRFHLVVGGAAIPGLASSATPFDVALGTDDSGTPVATYSRDRRAYVVRLSGPNAGRETRMRSISGPAVEPVVSGDAVAWIIPGTGRLPRRCDRLALRRGSGKTRFVSSACRVLTGLTIDGASKRIAWSSTNLTGADSHGAGRKTSSIKVAAIREQVPRTVQTTSFGEEGNVLSSPSISAGRVYYTQTGIHPRPAFVSAGVASGRPATSPAGTALAGPLAVDGPDAYYLLGADDGEDCGPLVPCELVHAATKDLAPGAARQLPPELSVGYTPAVKPPAGTPLTLAGVLQRRTVRDGATISTAPIPGEAIDVLSRSFPRNGTPEAFSATTYSATTGADGAWSVKVPAPDEPFFSARVRSTGLLAGRGTVGYCPAGTVSNGNGSCS